MVSAGCFNQNLLCKRRLSKLPCVWHSTCTGELPVRLNCNDQRNTAMKSLKNIVLVTALGLGLVRFPAWSADTSPNPPEKPERPEKPEPPRGLPPEVREQIKQLIQQFREEQKEAIEEWRKLAREMREATKEQREQLREQLRQILEEQKEKREQLREQIRERLEQLARELPNRREVIEAAKEQLRSQKKHGRGE